MVKYLIIRLSSIGDIVLTTPVVRCLKKQGENAQIHYLVKEQFAQILKSNPYIDKIHTFNGNLKECIDELKEEKFNYIIDLHKNLRSSVIKLKLKTKSLSFDKLNLQKWLMVNLKINKLPDVHIVDRYMKTIDAFIEGNDNKGLDYFYDENERVNLAELPSAFQNGYLAFAIGAKHATKRIPTEKCVSICNRINLPIVLMGGKSDSGAANRIKEQSHASIYNACGKYSLNESASLLHQARLVLTPDTGLMHIAAAFKKKIISVWGNTVPAFGMYPYLPGDESQIIEVENLKCRPCSKIGFEKCPKKHFDCMNKIDEKKIAELINKS